MLFPFTVAHVRNFRKLSLTISLKFSCIYCPQLQMTASFEVCLTYHVSEQATFTCFPKNPKWVPIVLPTNRDMSYHIYFSNTSFLSLQVVQPWPWLWRLLGFACPCLPGGESLVLSFHFSASYLFSTSMSLILTVPQEN